ncbi:hypothetical protein DL98DRAFT_175756 [Cadophora sp. DSE1049]|nr:hypothetical protein DL98DRAFT_175756 [Cadophora sp. DSE1049]
MVCIKSIAAAVVLNAVVLVNANPDTKNWGASWSEAYTFGNEWGDKDAVKQHIENACYGYNGNRGFYQDAYFQPWNQFPFSSKLCVNIVGGHVNFEIANLNPNAGFTLAKRDCKKRLSDIVDSTRYGGEWQGSGWWYRADPNQGRC